MSLKQELKIKDFCEKNGGGKWFLDLGLGWVSLFQKRAQAFLQAILAGNIECMPIIESREQGGTSCEHGKVHEIGTGPGSSHWREKWRLCVKTAGPEFWSLAEPAALPKQAEERPKTHPERFNEI